MSRMRKTRAGGARCGNRERELAVYQGGSTSKSVADTLALFFPPRSFFEKFVRRGSGVGRQYDNMEEDRWLGRRTTRSGTTITMMESTDGDF